MSEVNERGHSPDTQTHKQGGAKLATKEQHRHDTLRTSLHEAAKDRRQHSEVKVRWSVAVALLEGDVDSYRAARAAVGYARVVRRPPPNSSAHGTEHKTVPRPVPEGHWEDVGETSNV